MGTCGICAQPMCVEHKSGTWCEDCAAARDIFAFPMENSLGSPEQAEYFAEIERCWSNGFAEDED